MNTNTHNYTQYQLKIKIISIHFKIRAINDRIVFILRMGSTLMDTREITIKDGLIVQSATLQCRISQKDLSAQHEMEIVLVQKTKSKEEAVGNISFKMQEFNNSKMRRFRVQNCFDNSAYLEAFLLSIPIPSTHSLSSTQSQPYERPLATVRKIRQSQISLVDIRIDEQKQQYEESQSITFNDQSNSKVDTISLVTLNEILTQNNQQLTLENQRLKLNLEDLQHQLKIQAQMAENSNKLFMDKVKQLQNLLLSKQCQLQLKTQSIEQLTLSLTTLQTELSELRERVKKEVKEELKVDSLVIQLSRYAESKTKPKWVNITKKEQRLTQVPKIPTFTLRKQTFFKQGKQGSRSSRLYKQACKSMTMTKCIRHDQTADTMKQHSVVLSIK